MPENSWSDPPSQPVEPSNQRDPLAPLESFMIDDVHPGNLKASFERGLAGRRPKAAIALSAVWAVTITLHLVSWGIWFVLGLTLLVGLHTLRLIVARPRSVPSALTQDNPDDYPYVSLMVSAKNEEAVVGSLVRSLCNLDYPSDRYDLWIIDDYSTDRTPELLDQLALQYPRLHVVHRPADAGGGKSGALNQVYPQVKGEFIAVFDADAQVPMDLLRRVIPLFDRPQVGAVQVRKAVLQGNEGHPRPRNFWILGQVAEMALDSYFQQQRIAIGGVGELRGNGQFVRRQALDSCGGWNEETITDDLDLTLRLHFDRWDIDFLMVPAVEEEGVTQAIALWHQRSRWAEGGYQRYLDYWRLMSRNRLGVGKTIDLLVFWLMQYLLPTAAVPDTLMAIARSSPPLLSPLTGMTVLLSLFGMVIGLRRIHSSDYRLREEALGSERSPLLRPEMPLWRTAVQSLRGTLYMMHWLLVVASTTARISVRPKRLKWVKTAHQGTDEVLLDMPGQS
ncbi:MAG: glycosyltransferase family 2 protein [Synechococcales cyanobacterium K44_A2020_017]|nr:glycosyltransferase family 2 protein [Synechococcales cyanobacterium K32_A2020_035]MBF2094755.1 glycosyltransferase family 2 protein [Synechococcales cyanobacterium K44_A2020_017]